MLERGDIRPVDIGNGEGCGLEPLIRPDYPLIMNCDPGLELGGALKIGFAGVELAPRQSDVLSE